MLELAQQRWPSLGRDALRSISKPDRAALRRDAVAKLPASCILDMHLSIRTPAGLEASLPPALEKRAVDLILILEAPPNEVLARRASRGSRIEVADTVDSIEAQQGFNREVGHGLAAATGAPLEILRTSVTAEETARNVNRVLARATH